MKKNAHTAMKKIPERTIFFFLILCMLLLSVKGFSHEPAPTASKNLIPNQGLFIDNNNDGIPDGWRHGIPLEMEGLTASQFGWDDACSPGKKALWIMGGKDLQGEWSCAITEIQPDRDYLLTFFAYRDVFLNKIYPEVEIMDQTITLDNHCTYKAWHYFQIPLHSGAKAQSTTLTFINRYPVRFSFCQPGLIQLDETKESSIPPLSMIPVTPENNPFPIGIYSATIDGLEEIKKTGFNTVILDPHAEKVERAHRLGLKVILSLCGVKKIAEVVKRFSPHPALLAWYIEDEPEIASRTPEIVRNKLDQLLPLDPNHPTCMAIVRSRFVKSYKDSCHIFMLDQYPIPHQPITWLSDSLDEASAQVGNKRTWAVIQAFGGDEFIESGWPVFPSLAEMRSLAYLSLIHKASGLFFFSYRYAGASQERWERIQQVIKELNALREWLPLPPEEADLTLRILSPYKVDAKGRNALHYQWKRMKDKALLIMVNTIDKEVEMSLNGFPTHVQIISVLFEDRVAALRKGNLRDTFGPHQTHIYEVSSWNAHALNKAGSMPY